MHTTTIDIDRKQARRLYRDHRAYGAPRSMMRSGERTWRRLYQSARVEDIPDNPVGPTLYLVGEDENLWAAAMLCPCGCGERIELNLLPQVRPRWSAEEHEDHTVTLTPSVWRQSGCRSHFILRRGHIIWC